MAFCIQKDKGQLHYAIIMFSHLARHILYYILYELHFGGAPTICLLESRYTQFTQCMTNRLFLLQIFHIS